MDHIPHLFHFTDVRNLPSISEHGGLYSAQRLQELGILGKVIRGGNEWSRSADAWTDMDRYVHLCFTDDHPMEYLAKQDGRILESRFLTVHAEVLHIEGTLFCDGVSNRAQGVSYLPALEAGPSIDFEVLYEFTDWHDANIQARRKRARKYEILVPDFVPIKLITGF